MFSIVWYITYVSFERSTVPPLSQGSLHTKQVLPWAWSVVWWWWWNASFNGQRTIHPQPHPTPAGHIQTFMPYSRGSQAEMATLKEMMSRRALRPNGPMAQEHCWSPLESQQSKYWNYNRSASLAQFLTLQWKPSLDLIKWSQETQKQTEIGHWCLPTIPTFCGSCSKINLLGTEYVMASGCKWSDPLAFCQLQLQPRNHKLRSHCIAPAQAAAAVWKDAACRITIEQWPESLAE